MSDCLSLSSGQDDWQYEFEPEKVPVNRNESLILPSYDSVGQEASMAGKVGIVYRAKFV